MDYTVVWEKMDDRQTLSTKRFRKLDDAIAEANKAFDVPFKVEITVENDDGLICHRTYSGRGD